MAELMEIVGGFGLVVIFVGMLPMIITVILRKTSPEAFTQAMQTSVPFLIVGLAIVAFASAFLER